MEIHRTVAVILSLCVFLLNHPSKSLAWDIEGRINVARPWPKIQKMEVKKDRGACGHSQESQSLLISKEGYLRNAVVWLEGDTALSSPNAFAPALNARSTFREELDVLLRKRVGDPNSRDSRLEPSGMTTKPLLDQKNCHFDPHILLVPQGQSFLIGNRDPMGHDVRAFDGPRMLFRFDIESNQDPVEKKFEKSGRFVIRCGLHSWMHAYVVSTDHPYYALSDIDGTFHLGNVPEGSYTLNIWHERLGEAGIPMEVSQSVTDFSYTFPSVSNE